MPSSEVEYLMARAMIGLDEEENQAPPSHDPTGWQAIARLHGLANREVLDASLAACTDIDPLRRRVAAAVLGQLGHTQIGFKPVFTEERYQGLAGLLATELAGTADSDVLSDACVALGHLHDPRAIAALLELRTYPDTNVRFGVAFGLMGYETPETIDGLIALSSDSDEDVRDWSVLGLGMMTADTPSIRAALRARMDDSRIETRHEAIEGLARRGDQSVLPALIRALQDDVSLPLLEAAIALASPELCKALTAAAQGGLAVKAKHGLYDLTEVWLEAMRACGCQTRESG